MSTSLEKSHSKSSNALLTLICFMLTLSISAVWVGVSLLLNIEEKLIAWIVLGSGALLTLLFLGLVNKFTR